MVILVEAPGLLASNISITTMPMFFWGAQQYKYERNKLLQNRYTPPFAYTDEDMHGPHHFVRDHSSSGHLVNGERL